LTTRVLVAIFGLCTLTECSGDENYKVLCLLTPLYVCSHWKNTENTCGKFCGNACVKDLLL